VKGDLIDHSVDPPAGAGKSQRLAMIVVEPGAQFRKPTGQRRVLGLFHLNDQHRLVLVVESAKIAIGENLGSIRLFDLPASGQS
jgi:hypothetical protein